MISLSYILLIILGLIIGSFINMLVYRLPIMTKRDWHIQCAEFLKQDSQPAEPNINLCYPRSHCPQCGQALKVWHNIPLLSFLLLKGRCGHCKKSIPMRYPIIEMLSAIVAAIAFWRFGHTWAMGGACILSWGLIAVSVIDIDELFIPDCLTISLLWLGLLFNAFYIYTTPTQAIIGAIVGYLLFWCIAKLFLIIRKKEGLGYGDFKLLAMLAAWLGLMPIINIILVSSITGLIACGTLMLTKKLKQSSQVPFGPFLAFAGWCTMIFGPLVHY